MKCFVGVDLGSTTTKAVVLDEQERLLGRGITNSRSNYDVACAVARSEAFVNARFGLFARKLSEAGLAEKDSLDLTSGLERHFRRVQYAIQQEALAETMRAGEPPMLFWVHVCREERSSVVPVPSAENTVPV